MVLNINESTVTEKNLMNPRSPQTFFNESGGTGRSRSTLRLRSYQLDWWTKCTQLVYITVLLERSIHTNVDKFVWIIVLTILLCSRPILSCFPNIQPIALFTTWSYSLGARGRFKAEPCNRCWFFFMIRYGWGQLWEQIFTCWTLVSLEQLFLQGQKCQKGHF